MINPNKLGNKVLNLRNKAMSIYDNYHQALTMSSDEGARRIQDMIDTTFEIRRKYLFILLVIQVIWNLFLMTSGLAVWALLNLPLLAGIVLLLVYGRMDNERLQNWSKVLFIGAITKAVVIIIFFSVSMIELLELSESQKDYVSQLNYWEFEGMMSGAFLIVDLIAAYICLLIIRRTTQYASLLRRKEFFEFRSSLEDTQESDRAL